MESGFKVGDLVWTRVKKHPAWPARIEPQPEQAKKKHVYVYFFGAKPEEQYGWIPYAGVIKYDHETKAKLVQASNRADFKLGIEQIEAEYNKQKENSSEADVVEGDNDEAKSEPAKKAPQQIGEADTEPESEKAEIEDTKSEPPKRTRQPNKRYISESSDTTVSPTKPVRGKRKSSSDPMENGKKPYKMMNTTDSIKDDYIITDELAERNELTSVDFSAMSETLAANYTIGFLGLGIMSTGMVNNLINAGHKVNLWSRDNDKCNKLKEKADEVKEGRVNVCMAPCDVMKESDIVFNCSSDPESAKKNVLENCGVIHGMDSLEGKGFVEMTGIDPRTSLKICEAIQSKGGRYLEAQLQGSREEAANGTLLILAAGDNKLFRDCQTCFEAIAQSAHFLGEVGVATKMYLIMQLMQGISLVGLAESLVLADRCGISGKDVVNIFNMTSMSSPYLTKKAVKIVNKDFKQADQSIKNMQKDIRLALGLSEDLMQPLMMGSASNEVFKHSRKLGFDDHDCSCIYMKARF